MSLPVRLLLALVRTALPLLEQAGDHAGLVHVWVALAFGVANWRCRFEDHAHASEQALHHARLAGQRRSHLAGTLGAAILDKILVEKWARREKDSRAVVFSPRSQGMTRNVDRSGSRYISLSWIRAKPSMDEPSNHSPCSTASASL